ncbi:PAP2 domain containing protein [Metarhizium brunneum]
MAHSGSSSAGSFSVKLLASYAFDWIVLVVITVVAGFLGRIEPNKRPFALDDPNISFPFTEKETVPTWLLVILCALVPVIVIFLVSMILIPGSTVPKNTGYALIWKRKVWELHVGWLGLLMAVGSAFFFISGIKNMCGKPRPDLLSRCEPDIANAAKYIVGGFGQEAASSRLYSGDICKQADSKKLDDGFRSYPSGHAAASAAGLIYLSLFLASKFSVTLPFVVPSAAPLDDSMHSAFPSRTVPSASSDSFEQSRLRGDAAGKLRTLNRNAQYNTRLQSMRRQAAAPPIYLLAITLVPFCLAIFIAASRWFDFRHHGFDILFGFLIGTITAIYSFRYYHLPIMAGAGWAWGPRSDDRAFWAGVGRLGFAGDNLDDYPQRLEPADLGESGDVDVHGARGPSAATGAVHRGERPVGPADYQFQDVELNRMNQGGQPPYGQAA